MMATSIEPQQLVSRHEWQRVLLHAHPEVFRAPTYTVWMFAGNAWLKTIETDLGIYIIGWAGPADIVGHEDVMRDWGLGNTSLDNPRDQLLRDISEYYG